jgi:localization factor PodJL
VPVTAPAGGAAASDQDTAAADKPMENLEAMAPAGEGPVTPVATPQPLEAAASPAEATADAAVAKIDVPADAGPIPLREAAAAGDSKALFEVGARYAEGRGVGTDMGQAAQWYEKSAELGFAPAQYRIGNLYEKGNGVTRDVGKAKTWYQLAANQGNASAMHNLAVLFAMGANGTTDNDSAARWFTQAADLGVKDSQFNLGILAAKGVGMPQNLEESYKWFALVAKAGDKDAATKRDEIAKSLRPEQLERARASVELWKPKEMNPEANNAEIPESWQESQATTASVDMKKAIRNVQAILNRNGYDAGNPDGVMGQRTTDAIKAFQKDNGLDPSGSVDKALVEALLAKK